MVMYFGYWSVPMLIIFIGIIIFSIYAQGKIKKTYKRFSEVPNRRGLTGRDLAEDLKIRYQMLDLGVNSVSGELTDHFDPRNNTLGLSDGVANNATIASLAIVAHEMGHARQNAEKSVLFKIRTAILPVLQISSQMAIPLILFGFIFNWMNLVLFGIIAYAVIALFQIVTVPMEIDASKRGLKILQEGNYLDDGELKGAKSVLSAAALTYIAALAATLFQLLRLVLSYVGRR